MGRAVSAMASLELRDDAVDAALVFFDGECGLEVAVSAREVTEDGRGVRGSRANGSARIRNCGFGRGFTTAERMMGDILIVYAVDEEDRIVLSQVTGRLCYYILLTRREEQ